jgi:hypothetical protein
MAGLAVSVRMSSHTSNEIGRVKLDVRFLVRAGTLIRKDVRKSRDGTDCEEPNQTGINYRSKLGSVIFMISLS